MKTSTITFVLRVSLMALVCISVIGCATQSDIKPQSTLRALNEFGSITELPATSKLLTQEYWRALGDPQLNALIDEALADSPTLKLADTRIRRAAAVTDAAQSASWPQVSAGFDSTAQRFTENGLVPKPVAGSWRTNSRLALDASINLDLWGKYRRGLEGAEALRAVAQAESQAARLALSTSIARAWVEFDRLHRHRDHVDRMINARRELEKLQALRVSARLDANFDHLAQQQSIATLQMERAQIDERIGLQRNLIAALAGKGPDRGAQLTEPHLADKLDAGLPSMLSADLIGNRPDVLASRWRVEAAARDIDVARTQFYPDVNLVAFLGFSSLGLDRLIDEGARIAGIGPAIRLPIFEAGRLRANLATKTADYDAAVEQYNAALVDALREVSDQARSLQGAQRQGDEAAKALDAAQRSVQLVETRIKQRLANRIQLLTAEIQVMAQERIDVDLHALRLDAALALDRALGGGLPVSNNPFTLAAKQ